MINTNSFVNKEQFAKRLQELFEKTERKAIELETKLKVGRATVSRWRNGHTTPNDSQIKEIADFFGVRYQWLIGKDEFKTMEDYKNHFFPNGKIKLNFEPKTHWLEFFGYKITTGGMTFVYDEEKNDYIYTDDSVDWIITRDGYSIGIMNDELDKIEKEVESFIDYKMNGLFENDK